MKKLLEDTKDQELSDSQLDELRAKKEALMTKSQNLFTKMYESMQSAQGAQGAGPDMGAGAASSASDDDVVDADFKEV